MSDDHRGRIKLLIDEDVSPWVAQRLREDLLVDAVHLRDRARLGTSDQAVLNLAFSEDRIVVTANVADFQRLAQAREVHPGIVVLVEGNLFRAEQLAVVERAVTAITDEISHGRDMVNRVLRISKGGTLEFVDLPKPET